METVLHDILLCNDLYWRSHIGFIYISDYLMIQNLEGEYFGELQEIRQNFLVQNFPS